MNFINQICFVLMINLFKLNYVVTICLNVSRGLRFLLIFLLLLLSRFIDPAIILNLFFILATFNLMNATLLFVQIVFASAYVGPDFVLSIQIYFFSYFLISENFFVFIALFDIFKPVISSSVITTLKYSVLRLCSVYIRFYEYFLVSGFFFILLVIMFLFH